MKDKRTDAEDPRLAQILEVIFSFAAGELTARGTIADDGSALDGVMAGVNILGEELQARVAEARQARQTLAESETLLRGVFDSMLDGIIVAEAKTRQHRMVNNAICRMLGYSREELLAMSVKDIHPEKDLPDIAREFERIAKAGSGIVTSLPMQRKDGSVFYADLNSSSTTIDGVACLVGVFRDISERRQAEEKGLKLNQALEEKVRQLLETQEELKQHRAHLEQEVVWRTASLTQAQRIAHLGSWEWDLVNSTVSWSDETYRIFGYAPQQIDASYAAFRNAVHPEDRKLVDDTVREALARQHTYSIEHRILQPDGTLRHVRGHAEVMQGDQGQAISMVGTLQDITENKLATEALAASEFRFRTILDAAVDGIAVMDAQLHRLVMGNRAFGDMLGYRQDELPRLGFEDLHPKESLAKVQTQFERQLKGELQVASDLPVKRKDGSVFFADISTSLMDYAGRPALLGIFHDVTGRKQAEQALRDSENRYRNLVETTGDLVWEVDENAIYTYMSPRAHAITGYQAAELIGTTPFDLMAPEEAKRVASLFTPLAAAQQPMINLENTRLHRDGHPVVFESSGVPFLDADGKLCGYRGIDRDITERKQAEQTIRDERNFSDTLIANQPGIFFVLDPTGRFIRWNDKLRDLLGYSDSQIAAVNALDIIHDADRPSVAQKTRETFEQGKVSNVARLVTKMGIRDFSLTATRVDTATGAYAVGVGTDITERKQMEAELRDNELAYRTLSQNLPGLVYRVLIREGGRMQLFNAMAAKITGYAADELTAGEVCSIESLILDEDRPGVQAEVKRAIGEKRDFEVEYRLKHKDGGIRWMTEHGMPVYGTDGAPLYIDGVIFDITERKFVEAELQKLQEQLLEQSLHDPLTGLYNRRYLDVTIERELARATRNNQSIGILMCDLDHFKRVNDAHGHLAGDEVLRVFAALLKKHARGSDIVCRFGGEEFVMFLPDMSPAAAYQRAEQLRRELAAKRIAIGAAVLQVTASFGVAAFPENGTTMDSLISAVDAAMYQAKGAGRDRVVVSSERAAGGPALA